MAHIKEYTNKNVGIYKITNTDNGKVYIGQSINLPSRLNNHFRELKNNSHFNSYLQGAYNKHPDAFVAEIICLCREEDLDELEKYYIKMYMSTNPEYGYNRTEGGKWENEGPNKRPVICVETGVEYESGAAASRFLGLAPASVGSVCGKRGTSGGYHWVYKDDYEDDKEFYDRQAADANEKKKEGLTGPRNKKIVNLTIGIVFRNLEQLAEPYKSGIYRLEKVLEKGGGHFDGMYWMYVKDYLENSEEIFNSLSKTSMRDKFDLFYMGGVHHG